MREITSGTRHLHGVDVPTFKIVIESANIIEVEAGSTGLRGGDRGHGGRTYFRVKNIGGTDMWSQVFGVNNENGFEVRLCGDIELMTMIETLEFITQALKDSVKETTKTEIIQEH